VLLAQALVEQTVLIKNSLHTAKSILVLQLMKVD